MKERVIVMLIAFGSIVLCNKSYWKSGMNKRERSVSILLMLIALYLGIQYAANLNMLGLYELVDLVFTDTALTIDKWLTVSE